jgi:N-acetyltransferase
MIQFQSVALESQNILLRPLSLTDVPAIQAAASDGALWNIKTTTVPTVESASDYVGRVLDQQRAGQALPYVIVVKSKDRVVGSTRYMNIDAQHHRVEIGGSWIANSWQRSFVNSESKLLMLSHAFDTVGCNVVEFRTDVLNKQSRQAIERLGARQDGILRNHMIMRDQRVRDTVVYSILRSEWPHARGALAHALARRAALATMPEGKS